jgi:hypothetical protein
VEGGRHFELVSRDPGSARFTMGALFGPVFFGFPNGSQPGTPFLLRYARALQREKILLPSLSSDPSHRPATTPLSVLRIIPMVPP